MAQSSMPEVNLVLWEEEGELMFAPNVSPTHAYSSQSLSSYKRPEKCSDWKKKHIIIKGRHKLVTASKLWEKPGIKINLIRQRLGVTCTVPTCD